MGAAGTLWRFSKRRRSYCGRMPRRDSSASPTTDADGAHGADGVLAAFIHQVLILPSMLFMVIEQFRGGDPKPVRKRFEERGRMLPDGVTYQASWIDAAQARCRI